MSAFYKNNKFIELAQKQPTFAVSEDQAPDASFSSAGSSGGESKGILSIMEMIKEDLEDEITNAVKMEKEDQFYFERSLNEAHTLLKELYAKKTNLEVNIADTNTEIDNEFAEREDLNDLLTEEREYIGSIQPDCEYLYEQFDTRRAKRETETQSLIDAKGMLEGSEAAGTGAEEEAAAANEAASTDMAPEVGGTLLQTNEDGPTPRMGFSGTSSFLG